MIHPLVAGLFLLLTSPSDSYIYVSTSGSDDGDGTLAAPLQTVDAALALSRTVRTSPNQRVRIEFAPGDYVVPNTIDLTADDSHLIFETSGKARLLRGIKFAKWSSVTDPTIMSRLPATAQGHVLQSDITVAASDQGLSSVDLRNYVQGLNLVYDHSAMPLARWPNAGTWGLTGKTLSTSSFTAAIPNMAKWKNPGEIWGQGYWHRFYADELMKVTTVDPVHNIIGFSVAPAYGLAANSRYYLMNILEELDSPGEWYADRTTNLLYFWPPSGLSGHEVMLTNGVGPLVNATGITDLAFKNLTLEGGREAAINVSVSNTVTFSNCVIRNFGASAATMTNVYNSGLDNCTVSNVGTYGVSIAGGNRLHLTPGNNYVTDSQISNVGQWLTSYQPAIKLDGVANHASYNNIHDTPHVAVMLSGNDEALDHNQIWNACTQTADAGAIYMGRDPSMRGTSIQFNYLHDIYQRVLTPGYSETVVSIYLDDLWTGTNIRSNVFQGDGVGVKIGGGRDNTIQYNVFLDKAVAVQGDARGDGWAAPLAKLGGTWHYLDKVVQCLGWGPLYGTRYPALMLYSTDPDPLAPRRDFMTSNVCLSSRTFQFVNNPQQTNYTAIGNVNGPHGTVADALKLAPIGFPYIDMKTIGPRPLTTTTGP